MAHRKAAGSTSLGRDSQAKRLGIKIVNGDQASIGDILVKQRGTQFRAGKNVALASDHSLYALKDGRVHFTSRKITKFNGQLIKTNFVNIE